MPSTLARPLPLPPPPPRTAAATRVLERVLAAGHEPYPQVVVEGCNYWLDPADQGGGGILGGEDDMGTTTTGEETLEAKFEIDDSARSYRAHFVGYDHQNFTAVDEDYGPVVLSVKHYNDPGGGEGSGDGALDDGSIVNQFVSISCNSLARYLTYLISPSFNGEDIGTKPIW